MAAYYQQQAKRPEATEEAEPKGGDRASAADSDLPRTTQLGQHAKYDQPDRQGAMARANRLAAMCEELASAAEEGQDSVEVGPDERERPILTTTAIAKRGHFRSWPTWAATGLSLSLAILLALRVSRFVATAQTFAGVVTDTVCANHHSGVGNMPTGECVRTCVKLGRGRYALYDGTSLYVLSDQQAAEHFAAQRVQILGTLDRATNLLTVQSIRATS